MRATPPTEAHQLSSRPSLKSWQMLNGRHSYCKTKASSSRLHSPTTEMVIMTDRRREAYIPSKILRTEPVRAASPPPPAADPVAEALELIQADMTAQALSATADGAGKPTQKEPITIRLKGTVSHDAAPIAAHHRRRAPSPPPKPAATSIFPDDIENFCLQVKRGGRGGTITERFGELLQRQTAVQQLQRRLQMQTAEMRAVAKRAEEEADKERRERFAIGEEPRPPPAQPVPPTTAADTLLVLREQGGCCGAADLCLTPHDLPRALALIHRLRCEVLELRACSLRATCEKNEVAARLNHERAQLRRTFTSAQIDRLTGNKVRGRWDAEDVRRAIAARRMLTRRQYRYVTEVMRVPLPSLKLRNKAIKTSEETKRLYEQLVAEKVLTHMTKKRRVNRPARPAAAAAGATHPDGLISVASVSSDSEDGGFDLQ